MKTVCTRCGGPLNLAEKQCSACGAFNPFYISSFKSQGTKPEINSLQEELITTEPENKSAEELSVRETATPVKRKRPLMKVMAALASVLLIGLSFSFIYISGFAKNSVPAGKSAPSCQSGKMTDLKYGERKIYFERSENTLEPSAFQTVYKVSDEAKNPFCVITLTHDSAKETVHLSVKKPDAPANEVTVKYDAQTSGMIFSDRGSTDTAFNMALPYQYVFSFSGPGRRYIELHEITSSEGEQIQLEPLTEGILKQQAAVVNALPPAQPATAEKDSFKTEMLQMRDSFYAESAFYYKTIDEYRRKMDEDILHYFNGRKLYAGESRYEGEMKSGKPEGRGLLVEDGNVYDGIFSRGVLSDGYVTLKKDVGECSGKCTGGAMNGIGWLRNKNGDFSLGVFSGGNFSTGITYTKDANGEVYFGIYKNSQRSGYGELRTPSGSRYFGEFSDGRLVKGYAREVDQFGYSSYSRIQDGNKKAVEQAEAGEFFDRAL